MDEAWGEKALLLFTRGHATRTNVATALPARRVGERVRDEAERALEAEEDGVRGAVEARAANLPRRELDDPFPVERRRCLEVLWRQELQAEHASGQRRVASPRLRNGLLERASPQVRHDKGLEPAPRPLLILVRRVCAQRRAPPRRVVQGPSLRRVEKGSNATV